MKKKQSLERLERLFQILPILHANPGISLETLETLLQPISRKTLMETLERMILFGTPPFTPADFLDINITRDGRVYLQSALGLEEPVELDLEEWKAIEEILRSSLNFQDAGSSGLENAGRLLERISGIPIQTRDPAPFERMRSLIQEALTENCQIEFHYTTPPQTLPELRRVDPWAIFLHRGSAYLIAFCHLRKAARMFHLERMEDLELLEMEQEVYPPPELKEMIQKSPLFQKDDFSGGFSAEIDFRPGLRPALEEFFGFEGEPLPVGQEEWIRGSIRIRDSLRAKSFLRSLGPGIRIRSPEHFRTAFLEDLKNFPVPTRF